MTVEFAVLAVGTTRTVVAKVGASIARPVAPKVAAIVAASAWTTTLSLIVAALLASLLAVGGELARTTRTIILLLLIAALGAWRSLSAHTVRIVVVASSLSLKRTRLA